MTNLADIFDINFNLDYDNPVLQNDFERLMDLCVYFGNCLFNNLIVSTIMSD